MAPLNKWMLILFELAISLYTIINGWLIFKHRKIYINPAHRIGLYFVGWIYGQEEKNKKRRELTSEPYLMSLGKQMLIINTFAN